MILRGICFSLSRKLPFRGTGCVTRNLLSRCSYCGAASLADADGRMEIIEQHEGEARQNGEPCGPSEGIRAAAVDDVRWRAISHYLSEQEAGNEAPDVGVIIDARHQYVEDQDVCDTVKQ